MSNPIPLAAWISGGTSAAPTIAVQWDQAMKTGGGATACDRTGNYSFSPALTITGASHDTTTLITTLTLSSAIAFDHTIYTLTCSANINNSGSTGHVTAPLDTAMFARGGGYLKGFTLDVTSTDLEQHTSHFKISNDQPWVAARTDP
jgi:hypothetical protein